MKSILSALLIVFGCQAASGADDSILPKRFAKIIAVTGKATAVKPDGSTLNLRVGDELPAGSVIKTTDGAVDLFFRRIGTIVQMQANSELSLDKLDMLKKDGKLLKRTELSLKEGGIYACIRVLIPESKVLVKSPNVEFHVPGTGMGRFEFRADGSVLVGRRSKLTVVAMAGANPVSVAPGQYFDLKSTNAIVPSPTKFEVFTRKMDVLQNTAATLTPPPEPEELP